MYAPVLLVCIGPGFATPSAFKRAAVSSSARWRSAPTGKKPGGGQPSIIGMDGVLRWKRGSLRKRLAEHGRPFFDSSALSRNPLVGKQDGCPAIGIAVF